MLRRKKKKCFYLFRKNTGLFKGKNKKNMNFLYELKKKKTVAVLSLSLFNETMFVS